ncbi:MAG: type VI secretion system tube protein Hcp [Acidobacteriota bacterium]
MGSYKAYLDAIGVPGTSTDAEHAGQIEILSHFFGDAPGSGSALGGSSGVGKVRFNQMNFSKKVDAASAIFFTKCSYGGQIAKARLLVKKTVGDSVESFAYLMYDIRVSAIS